MTLVAGFAPDAHGHAGLELAAMLARSIDEDVVVASVVPAPWVPGPARVDAEYQAELAEAAEAALDAARAVLPGARFEVVHARSVPAGLLDVASAHSATALVLGSHGSVADRLLHSAHVPLALAPDGFHCRGECPVRRVTAAFGGTDAQLLAIAGREAARVGAALRVASFAVRPRAPITAGVGQAADRAIVAQWETEIRAAVPDGVETVIGHGETWEAAIGDVPWDDGDVLVVGSSSIGPVARVFLGSRAGKIVRHAPVPVIVVPREALA